MNQEHLLKILYAPHVSEKATGLADNGYYVFRVAMDATKTEIGKAVELFFKVKVRTVRTLVRKGKTKRSARGLGKRKDFKIAYVCLEAGHEIDFVGAAE